MMIKKLTIVLTVFIFIVSCNKNDGSPASPAEEFKAEINGAEWVADSVVAVRVIDYGPLPNTFEIYAYKNDGSRLFLKTFNDTNSVTAFKATLFNFSASINHAVSNAIHLIWQTASEDNLKSFVIEKSIDGNNFYDVATINASNKKNGDKYSYKDKLSLDEILLSKAIYYRLRMVDFDNSFQYSSITIANPSTPALYIFPSQDYSWGFNGKTTITAVDRNLKLVSGNFNFKCVNDTTGEQFAITNGSFKNLHYTE